LGCALALTALGCTSADPSDTTSTGSGPLPGPSEWNKVVTPPSDTAAAAAREKCEYKAGALPAETQGESHPMGSKIPIDHVLIVMMENRSFDHYFQKLPENGQKDVSVAPADFSNPDPTNKPVPIYHQTEYCFVDTNHEYEGSKKQVNGGKMDGFVATNEGHHEKPVHGTAEMLSGTRAMGYYDQTDLPFYFWLANEFAIGDRYHASVLGPTWPNRMYLLAATSFGLGDNVPAGEVDKSLADYLALRQLDWRMYSSGSPSFALLLNQYFKPVYKEHVRKIDEFYADVAAGTLPPVAFVEPQLGKGTFDANDEHPPAHPQLGQAFVAKVIDVVSKSPMWPRTAIFITYDEHGGLYDHVPPPKACAPDQLSKPLKKGGNADFTTLGIRVPFIVVSPYAKKHFVSHKVYDHTSILRFIQARFVMPALTNRDANAEAPFDMFDFANPPHMKPPAIMIPSVDQQKLSACEKIFKP
jgi:phospholipase C